MHTSYLRLDPALPICWEDEHTLRIGFERARVRVRDPSAGAQRLIGSFASGFDPALLRHEAQRVGLPYGEALELFTRLKPALIAHRVHPAPTQESSCEKARTGLARSEARSVQPCGDLATADVESVGSSRPGVESAHPSYTISIDDDGVPARGFRESLCASREITLCGARDAQLVILVERFLGPLSRGQRWLLAEVPQLLVRFTDEAVHVGPVIRAHGGPCHACLSLAIVARDPGVPALAAQLHGTVPAAETAAMMQFAAAFATAFLAGWRANQQEVFTHRVTLPLSLARLRGAPSYSVVGPHPDCACTEVAEPAQSSTPERGAPVRPPAAQQAGRGAAR